MVKFKERRISLDHGGGGRAMTELIKSVFLDKFDNQPLRRMDDSALLELAGSRIFFTTDSFVVNPAVFPGGDIGKLAVCGTINDLAVSGARPLYLSAGFIVEEGLEYDLLELTAESMARECRVQGVKIVTGDFKVVEKGAADGLFVNTSGLGAAPEGIEFSRDNIRPSDMVIINGNVGDHEIAVLEARGDFGFRSDARSDCCSLYPLIREICEFHLGVLSSSGRQAVKFMRDPTRGGVAAVLCEIAGSGDFGLEVFEAELPVSEAVGSACDMLGFEPIYLANEGKVLVIADEKHAGECLEVMRRHPLGKDSRIIGTAVEKPPGRVLLRTGIGSRRVIAPPEGAQVPRIC